MELPVTSANVRPAGSIVWQSGLLIGLVLLAVSALSLMLGIVAQLGRRVIRRGSRSFGRITAAP